MSGGSLNYFYCQLEDHVGDFGDKELDELVKDLAELFHDREWYLSADYGVGTWIEAKDKFKEKWFTQHGRQERIEQYLSDLANEVRESFGMVKGRCKNCKHWKRESEHYGVCEYISDVRTHRSEVCVDHYEPREEK